ncbi:uncharacterized protein LOC127725481 [Mytilus californianus]|uniref:uncharacterized protein LOC127725481 n=1 Tax=Mytilus californianus TaxID=6549 RepID=UPI0022453D35|nr:uncharacterized protein LOC127725481 [Mytilus californianus]
MALSKSLRKGQIPVVCELCDGGNKIEYKCLDCEVLMCSKCKGKVHSRFKNASDHKVKNIEELGQYEEIDTFNFSDVKCLEHSNQVCCVYCMTCKKVICVKCVTKVHNGHTFIDEEELEDKKKVIRSGQKKVDRSVNDLSSTLDKVQEIKDQEDAKFRQTKQDIVSHREALKNEVDQYADNLVKNLEQTWKSNSRVIGAEQSKIDKKFTNLQTDSNSIKSVITSKDFVKFFDDFDKLAISLSKDEPLSILEFSLLGRFVPGKITHLNFGSMENGENFKVQHPKIEFKVAQQFTTKLKNVHLIESCSDGTLWISDNTSKKIQHIKFNKDDIEVMLGLDIQVFGMVVMNACNNLLIVAAGETRLKIVNSTTGQITDSNYDVQPYTSQALPECVHITNDHRVIVGVRRGKTKGAVIVMSQDGRHLAKYEEDSNKEQLFTCPGDITSTKNGYICVIDVVDSDHGRVMVLGKEGENKQVYTGHPKTNDKEKLFLPENLLTTPADNIVITDICTGTLHILNCEGNYIGYYNANDIGIIYPCSLALSTEGHMHIGCSNKRESPETLKAKLYELEYSGF